MTISLKSTNKNVADRAELFLFVRSQFRRGVVVVLVGVMLETHPEGLLLDCFQLLLVPSVRLVLLQRVRSFPRARVHRSFVTTQLNYNLLLPSAEFSFVVPQCGPAVACWGPPVFLPSRDLSLERPRPSPSLVPAASARSPSPSVSSDPASPADDSSSLLPELSFSPEINGETRSIVKLRIPCVQTIALVVVISNKIVNPEKWLASRTNQPQQQLPWQPFLRASVVFPPKTTTTAWPRER